MNIKLQKIMMVISDIIIAVFLIEFWFRYLETLPELAPLSTYQLAPLMIYAATGLRIISYFIDN